jgi:hypothetical protein
MRMINSKHLASCEADDDACGGERQGEVAPAWRRYGGGCVTAGVCVDEMRQPSVYPSLFTGGS